MIMVHQPVFERFAAATNGKVPESEVHVGSQIMIPNVIKLMISSEFAIGRRHKIKNDTKCSLWAGGSCTLADGRADLR